MADIYLHNLQLPALQETGITAEHAARVLHEIGIILSSTTENDACQVQHSCRLWCISLLGLRLLTMHFLHTTDRHSVKRLIYSRVQVWHRLSKEVLQPDDPFPLHRLLYQAAYQAWQPAKQVRGLVELRIF